MNRTLYAGDCLDILNDSDALPDGSVDLIYLDPPFNSNSIFNLPFKGKDKNLRPVEAFKDTWEWGNEEEQLLEDFGRNPLQRHFADLVQYALTISGGRARKNNLGAYLVNMAVRLMAMRRVLKDTSSIFLHCDPTASHYLKLLMDGIFERQNFRNEIVWCYTGPSNTRRWFPRKHDIILFYAFRERARFFRDEVRIPYKGKTFTMGGSGSLARRNKPGTDYKTGAEEQLARGKVVEDFWVDIPSLSVSSERLGYPTQKPLALLRRIIRATTREGDLVLDPFCGCGTAAHAAEALNRRWVGIDVSNFATGLIRERVLAHFPTLGSADIPIFGTPASVKEARELALKDRFEFEKWICGIVGAHGMFHNPGERGADRGVDGVIEFYPIHFGTVPKPHYAIVQVKSGHVTPDAVGRLYDTVTQLGATAGVLVCFADQMRTVENNRNRARFSDSLADYAVIQGLSVEELLAGRKPELPSFAPRGGGEVPGRTQLFEQ